MFREQRVEDFFLHPWMLSDLIPCFPYVIAVRGARVNLHLGMRGAAHQRDTFRCDVSLQGPHGIPVGSVCIREKQPKVHESVVRVQFIADDLHRLVVSANSRLSQDLHLCARSTDIPHECSHQGGQNVAILQRVFRYDEHGKAHDAISSHPSENNFETAVVLTASMKAGISAKEQILDSPVDSSRLQKNVVL